MRIRNRHERRTAVAAVEFAVVLPVLFTLLIGTWEIGRIVQVQQVMVNAAREGARIAAQGQTINTTGAYTQIMKSTGTPNVTQVVTNYMIGAGLTNTTGMVVDFKFVDGDTTKVHPYQGAKNQQFYVDVTLPYNNVRLTNLNLFNFVNLTTRVQWVSMADDPYTVGTTIPTWVAYQ